ncbi:radical SAM/CxCxxxxC motif protein YfkAB [Salisediminibacterium beveridgei]|uniref:Putative thioredoxin-like oxidoreductase n=1 Tax=Salisediminibacterium beveridgei TaxID=632773 RepID=A0A1D7QXF2_9BACI|nr:radical SAM/CxCxxxxC motif protein YfkAB [Salisediminibacterium beveridgei]AOM83685.1 putative thioredoxin-like oxidoreductase [Salisediminibacterium beveridgei]
MTHKISNTSAQDPWEAYEDIRIHGKPVLSNIEITTTHLCNMRCEHCAVGYGLLTKDPDPLPLELIIRRLDDVKHLRAFSITGGEPMMSVRQVKEYVIPLLKYAKERGAKTQINSNLTMPFERYEWILPYLDVLHISHNYGSKDDFADIGFAVMDRKPGLEQRYTVFETMVANAKALSSKGLMLSAETMINNRTLPHLEKIHDQIIAMGCQRHEVHPMYPASFAEHLPVADLKEIRKGIHRLLDYRNPDTWMLFGTLPFYPCSQDDDDLKLLQRLNETKNVTVRNDPDGRSRLNVNLFDGSILVTDFAAEGKVGNILNTSLEEAYDKWKKTALAKSLDCHCPAVSCLGPNLLVKNAYYPDVDFLQRKNRITYD